MGADGADYEALSKTARLFSALLDEVPAMVAAQLETACANDKARRNAGEHLDFKNCLHWAAETENLYCRVLADAPVSRWWPGGQDVESWLT